jgi:hypothetical protein
MIDKDTAGSAEGRSQARSAAASRAKATVAKPARRAAAGKPPSRGRYEDDMYQRIQRRAYELWESEGRPAGRDEANWLQAESEIARARAQRVGISQ